MIGDTQTFGSGFTKREFVLREIEGKYQQDIKLEVVKDACDKLDEFNFGDTVTAHFNIRGNEHNGKYYVSLQAWKIDREGTQDAHNESKSNGYQPQRPTSQNGAAPPARDNSAADGPDDADDIPFAPMQFMS